MTTPEGQQQPAVEVTGMPGAFGVDATGTAVNTTPYEPSRWSRFVGWVTRGMVAP